MNSEDQYKQQLAKRLAEANCPVADKELWHTIENRILQRQQRKTWYWYGIAASFFAVTLLLYMPSGSEPSAEKIVSSAELYMFDVALQQAYLTDPGSVETIRLLEQRKYLESQQPGSYEL